MQQQQKSFFMDLHKPPRFFFLFSTFLGLLANDGGYHSLPSPERRWFLVSALLLLLDKVGAGDLIT
jgi:hypothetical protein